jgi:hypothetical protein
VDSDARMCLHEVWASGLLLIGGSPSSLDEYICRRSRFLRSFCADKVVDFTDTWQVLTAASVQLLLRRLFVVLRLVVHSKFGRGFYDGLLCSPAEAPSCGASGTACSSCCCVYTLGGRPHGQVCCHTGILGIIIPLCFRLGLCGVASGATIGLFANHVVEQLLVAVSGPGMAC